jgi:hypothetical protein
MQRDRGIKGNALTLLIIADEKPVTGNDFDVYLVPSDECSMAWIVSLTLSFSVSYIGLPLENVW